MGKAIVGEVLGYWIMPFAHEALIRICEGLSEEEFSRQSGVAAPPAGWHLFHVARLADRLQVTLRCRSITGDYDPALPEQTWVREGLARHWGLSPDSLGYLEAGIWMTVENAVRLTEAGRDRHIDYARRMFAAVEQEAATITDEMLLTPVYSLLPSFSISDDAAIVTEGPSEVTLLDQLLFHSVHSQRHLGMIEALKGVMSSGPGTATI